MPPLTIEVGLGLAIIAAVIRMTTSINRIEERQKITHVEMIGKHELLQQKTTLIEREVIELKQELKESRRVRYSDRDITQ